MTLLCYVCGGVLFFVFIVFACQILVNTPLKCQNSLPPSQGRTCDYLNHLLTQQSPTFPMLLVGLMVIGGSLIKFDGVNLSTSNPREGRVSKHFLKAPCARFEPSLTKSDTSNLPKTQNKTKNDSKNFLLFF